MMDPRTGLLPGQSWSVPWGPTFQARIGRDGRAHCIGEALLFHEDYSVMYYSGKGIVDASAPWVDFETAMDQARQHNAAFAAKRQAAQAGQGGGE